MAGNFIIGQLGINSSSVRNVLFPFHFVIFGFLVYFCCMGTVKYHQIYKVWSHNCIIVISGMSSLHKEGGDGYCRPYHLTTWESFQDILTLPLC